MWVLDTRLRQTHNNQKKMDMSKLVVTLATGAIGLGSYYLVRPLANPWLRGVLASGSCAGALFPPDNGFGEDGVVSNTHFEGEPVGGEQR